jgi:hypothetical protein
MAKTLVDIREENELLEKLRATDPTGRWISDFVHSDNPKFAGKSKKERIRMALGASYAAKGQNEETEIEEQYYVKINNALKTTPSGAHVMKFPTRDTAERHAKEHKKRNPNHQVSVTNSAASNAAVWHGGTKTRPYAMAEQQAKDSREYDYEGDMAKSQLRAIMANAQQVHDMLDDNTNMAEWVQSKITLAADYISTVADYMQAEVKEEFDLDEAIKLGSKVMIHAPGKSYHGKTGHVGEIRHGAFKGAAKTYTVDHDGGSIQLDKKNIKMHAEEVDIDEAAWGQNKMANLKAAHDRHSEKAIAANRAGDDAAVKVHQRKMGLIKTQMNKLRTEDVALDEAKHRVSVTVSEPDHPMVTKRKEQQQKFVRVSGDREGAVTRAQQHFKKQGYRVHGAEYVGAVNEHLELDEAGGMKSAALVKAMQRKQKQTASMTPEKQAQQKQAYHDKKQQNEMSNVVFDNGGQSMGVSAGSIKQTGQVKPVHLVKPEKDAQARSRSLKSKEKKMKTEAKSLYDRHQELRKKSGLPDPSHYLKLAKQKQAEIDAMKADQGSTERLHTVAPEPHPGAQKTFTALRNKQ